MEKLSQLLQKLYQQTLKIQEHITHIDENMDNNEIGELETLLQMIDTRHRIIQRLDSLTISEIEWSEADREILQYLKTCDSDLQGEMQKIYQSFSVQMSRLQRGKQAARKYKNSYPKHTEGSFIDKRE